MADWTVISIQNENVAVPTTLECIVQGQKRRVVCFTDSEMRARLSVDYVDCCLMVIWSLKSKWIYTIIS